MVITVQVTERSAGPPDVGADSAAASAAATLGRELALPVRPMHPGSPDTALRAWFTIEAPDGAAGEHVLAELRRSPLVAAAYVKPPDAMP